MNILHIFVIGELFLFLCIGGFFLFLNYRLQWVDKEREKIRIRLNSERDEMFRQDLSNIANRKSTTNKWKDHSLWTMYESFDYMLWHFWIWDMNRFMKPEAILKEL